jgi:SAM-dependent methyltransferase
MTGFHIARRAMSGLNTCIKPLGLAVVRVGSLHEPDFRVDCGVVQHGRGGVDDTDRMNLVLNNLRLLDLACRYEKTGLFMGEPTLWKAGYVEERDLLYFRGDNPYIWQCRDGNHWQKYVLTYLYLKQKDHLGLFNSLREDGDYGVLAYATDTDASGASLLMSRDLLDSVNEILFLDRTLDIARSPGTCILDIGAGYGRLAYRSVSALQNIERYFCIDAVPCSTFLCDYYLRRKGVADRATTVPLDEQERLPEDGAITLAINIHSFSECSAEAVNYWMGRCAAPGIKYLFVVPNRSAAGGSVFHFSKMEGNFRPQIEAHGYKLQHAEPKYSNTEVQKLGVSPAWYYLFERVV